MKIAIITIHALKNNFGSVLQGYALATFIQQMGYKVYNINYIPEYIRSSDNVYRKIKLNIINLCFCVSYIRRKLRFDSFIGRIPLTKLYRNFEELKSAPPEADCYMAGSDQLWNPRYQCGHDNAFFLRFTDSANKMAYATSIGTDNLTNIEYQNIINNIKSFRFVSVREKVSAEQLVKLGRSDVKHVADPTFLLPASHYQKILKYQPRKKYICVYAIEKDCRLEMVVKRIAAITGFDVVTIGGFRRKSIGYFPRWIGPLEFLGFVNNAEFLIVSSFHGTAFSLIFEKQFIVVPPKSNSLRIQSILDVAGIRERMLTTKNINDAAEFLLRHRIDYSIVTPRLQSHIKLSKEFLINSISKLSKKDI